VIGNAVKVMRIATGEETEELDVEDGKDPAAKALGIEGGAARRDKLSPGIDSRLWSMEDVVRLVERREDLRSGALNSN
jgi:hypothetical protein